MNQGIEELIREGLDIGEFILPGPVLKCAAVKEMFPPIRAICSGLSCKRRGTGFSLPIGV